MGRSSRWLVVAAALTLLAACPEDTDTPSEDTAAQGDQGADATAPGDTQTTDPGGNADPGSAADDAASADLSEDAGGLPVCDQTGADESLLKNGEWTMGVRAAPVGGLTVPFTLHIVASSDRILSFEVWGRSVDGSWSSEEALARVCDVAVDGEGGFSVYLPTLPLPGQSNPAGVDLELVDFALAGTVENDSSMCGDVTGLLPTLSMDLVGSTFKAVPAGMETIPMENSCEGIISVTYDPIDTCPAVTEGLNTMTSAELEREFIVTLPADFAPAGPVPVVFLYHGLGGTAPGVLDHSDFAALQADHEFILVAPEGANDPDGEQVFPVDWSSMGPLYDMDNQDLVFFDDMLRCVGEVWDIDPQRVYVTGMSGGGLFSTFVGLNRSEVVAAAAPMSGGYGQTLAWPSGDYHKVPYLVGWGGETDIAVETDFHALAQALLAGLAAAGHQTVACNHDTGHEWPAEMTAAIWAWLSAWTLDMTEDPFAAGLTADFPGYCVK